MPRTNYRGASRGRGGFNHQANAHNGFNSQPRGSHRGNSQSHSQSNYHYPRGRGGGINHNHNHNPPHRHSHRRTSTEDLHHYTSNLHPTIATRYRNLRLKTLRLQTAMRETIKLQSTVDEILASIEELAPGEDHMDWSLSAGTVVYVPVPHPVVNSGLGSVTTMTGSGGPPAPPAPGPPSGSGSLNVESSNQRDVNANPDGDGDGNAGTSTFGLNPTTTTTTTSLLRTPPVHTEIVATGEGFYPPWPPTTVPSNPYDQVFHLPGAQQMVGQQVTGLQLNGGLVGQGQVATQNGIVPDQGSVAQGVGGVTVAAGSGGGNVSGNTNMDAVSDMS